MGQVFSLENPMIFETLYAVKPHIKKVAYEHLNQDSMILDFGGNQGNLLHQFRSDIGEANYTCVDVDQLSLNVGQRTFPRANFVHYNRFHPCYNANGKMGLLPSIEKIYDFAFSYSVFTHFNKAETIEIINWIFENGLKAKGKLLFTFLEPDACLYFLHKRQADDPTIQVEKLYDKISSQTSSVLIDGNQVGEWSDSYPSRCDYFLSFFTREIIESSLSDYRVKYFPQMEGFLQSYLMLERH